MPSKPEMQCTFSKQTNPVLTGTSLALVPGSLLKRLIHLWYCTLQIREVYMYMVTSVNKYNHSHICIATECQRSLFSLR